MKRSLYTLAIIGLLTAACGIAAPDTKATVAAEVNATLAAIPPQQITVPVTHQVVVTQEVIITEQVPIEVTVVVEVTAPPPGAEATPQPSTDNPPSTSSNPQDPLAGTNPTPIIDERFDFPDKYYWWTFDDSVSTSGEGKIENETYVLISKQTENYEWTFDGRKLQNFYASAKVVIPNEQCKAGDHWGLVFRYKDNARFYMFGVSCDGKYSLMKRTPDGFVTILEPTRAEAINLFGKENVLGVRAVGDQISLYVNDQFLITVADGEYVDGIIGMYLRTLLTPEMTLVVDDIKAYLVN